MPAIPAGKSNGVAVRNVLVDATPEQMWAVLADGWSYDQWVVGTTDIRRVDPGFPAEGTSLDYTVGRSPLRMKDRTTVRIAEPLRRLELEANARLVGTARIARTRAEPLGGRQYPLTRWRAAKPTGRVTRRPTPCSWRSAARAALAPQAPWTAPPGWAEEEAR